VTGWFLLVCDAVQKKTQMKPHYTAEFMSISERTRTGLGSGHLC